MSPNPTALARPSTTTALATAADAPFFTPRQREMIRNMFAGGASDEEFGALMSVAEARRLSPLHKQVYFVKRWDSVKRQEVWSVQTSIEGLRVIAERTGKYDGSDLPVFEYKKDGSLLSATVAVYRKDRPRPIFSKVFFDEAVQFTRDGAPTSFWKRMPHRMLAKCAESDALHRAFPEDMALGEDPYDADMDAAVVSAQAAVLADERPAPKPAPVEQVKTPKPAPVERKPAAAAPPPPPPPPPPAPAPEPEPEEEPEPMPPPAAEGVVDAEFDEAPEEVGSLVLPFETGKWVGKLVRDLNNEALVQAFYKGFRDVADKTSDDAVRAEKSLWANRVAAWAAENGWTVG